MQISLERNCWKFIGDKKRRDNSSWLKGRKGQTNFGSAVKLIKVVCYLIPKSLEIN